MTAEREKRIELVNDVLSRVEHAFANGNISGAQRIIANLSSDLVDLAVNTNAERAQRFQKEAQKDPMPMLYSLQARDLLLSRQFGLKDEGSPRPFISRAKPEELKTRWDKMLELRSLFARDVSLFTRTLEDMDFLELDICILLSSQYTNILVDEHLVNKTPLSDETSLQMQFQRIVLETLSRRTGHPN